MKDLKLFLCIECLNSVKLGYDVKQPSKSRRGECEWCGLNCYGWDVIVNEKESKKKAEATPE